MRDVSQMMIRRRRAWACAGVAAILLIAHSTFAAAQSRQTPYVSVGVLGDFKWFSGDPTTNTLDGQGVGGSVAVGSSLGARWDVELGVDVPRFTSTSESTSVTVRRQIITLESRTKNRAMSVAALVRYRPLPRGRVQFGYLAGLSLVRLQRRFDTMAPEGTPASLIPRPQELIDYGAAPTIGIDAAMAVAGRLSLVAAVHATMFSLRDVSGVMLRPRVGVRWQF